MGSVVQLAPHLQARQAKSRALLRLPALVDVELGPDYTQAVRAAVHESRVEFLSCEESFVRFPRGGRMLSGRALRMGKWGFGPDDRAQEALIIWLDDPVELIFEKRSTQSFSRVFLLYASHGDPPWKWLVAGPHAS